MTMEPRDSLRREPAAIDAGATTRGNRRGTPVAARRSTRGTAPATRGKPVVVKLGGRSLEAPGALREFASDLARLSRVTLLVHGGGAEVTAWSERLGLPARFQDGLRVTDAETLDVVTAVLAGLANKRLVAELRAHGVDAVGLAALDGGIVTARPHADAARLGAVGEIAAVDVTLLSTLLAMSRTPVLASVAATPAGERLNVNADDAASALAAALGASDLVLLSDTPGVRLDGAIVRGIAASELDATIARPDVVGGMVPKLRAAQATLAAGVARVHVAAWNGPGTLAALLAGEAGTTLFAHAPAGAPEASHA